jgi:hypothetical protein
MATAIMFSMVSMPTQRFTRTPDMHPFTLITYLPHSPDPKHYPFQHLLEFCKIGGIFGG